ncbi:MAG: gephyrin-like molybdotransferase Glp [Acidimicrobiia bacterium]
MISLDEARRRVLDACERVHPKAMPLSAALVGCVTSVPIEAPEAVPPFDNTAVDGYAVRAVDTEGASGTGAVELVVLGTVAAGMEPPAAPLGTGQTWRIMTGAPMPAGADAVVMVEDTDGGTEVVRITKAVNSGDSVRGTGDDVKPGDIVFDRFTELRPAHLGVLASLGYRKAPVFPKLKVGVLSTGDELVDDGSVLKPGQIREANRPMLLGLVEQAGAIGVDLGIARDTDEDITAAIERGLGECDALVTSGGVSMGAFDYIKVVLDRLSGNAMSWMQIAIKPAKPFSFGMIGGKPVFGLPGNPVSSLVSFELLARPALRQMMGHQGAALDRPTVNAVADDGLRRRPDGKTHFVRVFGHWGDDGRLHVTSTGPQGSHQLAATALANALAELPDGDGIVPGGVVSVRMLS